jgi:phosphatidate cytidylyltransferase
MELPKISENLKKRIISAGILAPIVLIIIVLGGAWFSTLIVLATVIMSFEWAGIVNSGKRPEIDEYERKKWMNYGILYVAIFSSSLLYLRNMESGFSAILFMLLVVWATDIAAYFTGRAIGGPKIYPKISPNKTWAGLAGGMFAAGIIGAFASVFMHSGNVFTMFILGLCLAVISQAGDFLESWIKRKFGVKDSGTIIPGHGGVMDRVDGITTVAPAFAIIALIHGGNFL